MKKIILILLMMMASARVFGQTYVPEDDLKAAFIFHFINYTEWDNQEDNLNVCIPNNIHLKTMTFNTLEGKILNNRRVSVVGSSNNCQILVSDSVPATSNILTIGPLMKGALLEFRLIDNKLKFAVNLEKLKKSRLKISSQLLKLAILQNGA